MNRFLTAIYPRHDAGALEALLCSQTDGDWRQVNEALGVVLRDCAMDLPERLHLCQLLLLAGADPNCRGPDHEPLLLGACARGETALVQLLLDFACDISVQNEAEQKTALHVAAGAGHAEVVGLLVEAGASTNVTDLRDNTPLMQAVMFDAAHSEINCQDLLKLLLVDYADIDKANDEGETPLFVAAGSAKVGTVEYLISQSADVKHRDLNEETCLFNTVRFGVPGVLDVLLSANALVNAKSKEGFTPLHEAVLLHKDEMVELLVKHNAHLDVKNASGNTPLILAIECNNRYAVKCLIQNNCNFNIRSYERRTTGSALQFALQSGNWLAGQMLLLAGSRCSLNDVQKLSTNIITRLAALTISGPVHQEESDSNDRSSRIRAIENLLKTPLSLRSLCRIGIKRSMSDSKCFKSQLKLLSLPQALEDFLYMKELDALWS